MNISKHNGLSHVLDWEGEEVKLTLNTSFSSKTYREFTAQLKQAVEDEDIQTLSEMCCFLVKKWNLEDDDGDIPLETAEVYKRVPMLLLTKIVTESQEAANNGGLTKNN